MQGQGLEKVLEMLGLHAANCQEPPFSVKRLVKIQWVLD
jgi:hypothetical protein